MAKENIGDQPELLDSPVVQAGVAAVAAVGSAAVAYFGYISVETRPSAPPAQPPIVLEPLTPQFRFFDKSTYFILVPLNWENYSDSYHIRVGGGMAFVHVMRIPEPISPKDYADRFINQSGLKVTDPNLQPIPVVVNRQDALKLTYIASMGADQPGEISRLWFKNPDGTITEVAQGFSLSLAEPYRSQADTIVNSIQFKPY